MKGWILAVLALGASACLGSSARADTAAGLVLPPHTLVISPGERIVLTFDPKAGPHEVSRGPASAADEASLPDASRTVEELKTVGLPGAPPKSGEIVASLWSSEAGGTKLRIDNGYAFPVIYHAFLIFERDGRRLYRATSICPVLPGRVGYESWGDHVVGMVLTGFESLSPEHMACNDGSVLTLAPQALDSDALFLCSGGDSAGRPSAVKVGLTVDAAGSIRLARAVWSLSTGDLRASPGIMFDFPLEGDAPVQWPDGLSVFAVVGLQPPPKARSADIVLLLDGVEKARRPWKLYAQRLASAPDPAKPAVAFYGVIPFFPDPAGAADAGLAEVLHAVGGSGHKVEVRVVGGDGSVLADATYGVDRPAVRSQALVDAALDEARAKAKTPAQCSKQTN